MTVVHASYFWIHMIVAYRHGMNLFYTKEKNAIICCLRTADSVLEAALFDGWYNIIGFSFPHATCALQSCGGVFVMEGRLSRFTVGY